MSEDNTENKIGRPTKYCQELLEKAKQYLEVYEGLGDSIPNVEGLCIYIGIRRSTAYDWAKHEDKAEFSDTLELINMTQKRVLLNSGLTSKFNSNITKLALSNHGFSDKQQTEISGPGGKAIEQKWTVEFVEAKDNDSQ